MPFPYWCSADVPSSIRLYQYNNELLIQMAVSSVLQTTVVEEMVILLLAEITTM